MNPEMDAEQRKWEAYYAQLGAEEVLREGAEVYDEIARAMASLVPPGAWVLEAACGSGRHSVELARHVNCRLHLLDFSPAAIACAQRVFAHRGVDARFTVGDAFAAAGADRFDLVFNSGVLEHYEQALQVDFLRAMAARSSRYVLVLVPNRLCHWYWIWRTQSAAVGRWPFGLEKAAGDYRHQIRQAGLHFLGQAYFGAAAVPHFLANVSGLSPELHQTILSLHQSQIFPPSQRSYLVAFLASKNADDVVPESFATQPAGNEAADWTDRCVSLAADALAAQIALRADLERLRQENDELRRQVGRGS
jgi:2-polyprenyl-3-methyl-5-hydroxy-6-metoxy-1,4-benzoquinol methylase